MILAAPLARALDGAHLRPKRVEDYDPDEFFNEYAAAVLPRLRADPATLVAIAEALWATGIRSEPEYGFVEQAAAALADALFGAKP